MFRNCPLETLHLGRDITSTYIYAEPFENRTTLKYLTIGNTVTTIVFKAFDGCSGLTGPLNIPGSVTSIGSFAFRNCSSMGGTLVIPDGIKEILTSSFEGCSSLSGLVIPESVTTIGERAFKGCSGLKSNLNFPNSISSIKEEAFSGCSQLSGTLSIPNGITTIYKNTFYGCAGFSELIIPNTVKTIGERAFGGLKGLTGTLIIPNSVTSIGESSFHGNGAQEIFIGHSITSIPANAFFACPNLESVTIGNAVTSIGNYAFSSSKLLSTVTLGKKVSSISSNSFAGSSVTEINSKNPTPPTVDFRGMFDDNINRDNCTLYVQWQYIRSYRNNTYWGGFYEILEKDFSSESDASLSNLIVESWVLSPSFQPNTLNYTVTVPNEIATISIQAATSSPNATITLDESSFNLNVGENLVTFTVTSEDKTTCSYLINIIREGNSQALSENNIAKTLFYPNPTIDKILFIQFDKTFDKIEIYNQNGLLVAIKSNVSDFIELSDLPMGTYLLRCYYEKDTLLQKIIVK